jgi:toxin ParE1/3/4
MRKLKALVWSPEAEQDLVDIWDYLSAEASGSVADRQLRRLDDGFRSLSRHPFRGRPRGELAAGIRSALVRPYIIFYRVTETAIEVVRVLHGRRDIDAIFAERDDAKSDSG